MSHAGLNGRHKGALRALAALSLAAALVALTCASAQAAPVCKAPPGPAYGKKSTPHTTADGKPALTEYDDGGAYRETICDASGQPVKAVVSAPFPIGKSVRYLPTSFITVNGENATVRTVTYISPLDPVWDKTMAGAESTFAEVLPPADRADLNQPTATQLRKSYKALTAPKGSLARAAADTSCSDSHYVLDTFAQFPNRAVDYYTRVSTYPQGGTTSSAIRNGAHAWNDTDNSCGYGDQNNITASNAGDTTSGPHTYSDGINVVDFGSLPNLNCNEPNTLACAYYFWSGSTRVGFDIRFGSTGITWVHAGQSSGYDVQAVATHEMGHGLMALKDVYGDHNFLTMYGVTAKGSIRQRDLARGDVLGMRAVYP